MNVKSPVTYSYNTSFVEKFDVAAIRQQYLDEVNVDTARFFEGLTQIELYNCNDTGYRFYHPDGIWGDGRFYEDLQKNNSWYYAKDRWEHRKGIELIHAGDKVLEIGCGDGVFLEIMNSKGITDIEALELNESAVKELKKAYPRAPITKTLGLDSTYLHLLVCELELRALTLYIGKKEARKIIEHVMNQDKIYPWIYRQVLYRNAPIRKIVKKYRLAPKPLT